MQLESLLLLLFTSFALLRNTASTSEETDQSQSYLQNQTDKDVQLPFTED
jgi:hypothetical protein